MRRTFGMVAIGGLMVASGCFYSASRGRDLEARIGRLEEEKTALSAALEAQKAQMAKSLDQLDRSSKRSGAGAGVQIDQLNAELSRVRGDAEQNSHRVEQLEARLAALNGGTPAAPSAASSGTVQEPISLPPSPDQTVEPKLELPKEKTAAANLVVSTLKSNPAQGRTLGAEWLKKWPKDPQAARVHYELGSSHHAAKEWRSALTEFGQVVKSFSSSREAPDALLKSADCFTALKKTEEAKLSLQEIVDSYPQSDAAKTARTRLAKMK